MPIIRLEIVQEESDSLPGAKALQALVDELAQRLGSQPAGTWLTVSGIPRAQYVENDSAAEAIRPVFVRILRYRQPDEETLARDAADLAAIVARHLDRPQENTHLVFEPDGAGRVAFGGQLVT